MLAQMFSDERKKYLKQGKIETAQNIAQNMLEAGAEIEFIMKMTGLSHKEIESLKKN